jgi:hypothetical protein
MVTRCAPTHDTATLSPASRSSRSVRSHSRRVAKNSSSPSPAPTRASTKIDRPGTVGIDEQSDAYRRDAVGNRQDRLVKRKQSTAQRIGHRLLHRKRRRLPHRAAAHVSDHHRDQAEFEAAALRQSRVTRANRNIKTRRNHRGAQRRTRHQRKQHRNGPMSAPNPRATNSIEMPSEPRRNTFSANTDSSEVIPSTSPSRALAAAGARSPADCAAKTAAPHSVTHAASASIRDAADARKTAS